REPRNDHQFRYEASPPSRFWVGAVMAKSGALLTYGPRLVESYRRTAYFVGRILKGTKPGDLPIEQPTRFELVVNRKTADAVGLTIPPLILARVDEVIE